MYLEHITIKNLEFVRFCYVHRISHLKEKTSQYTQRISQYFSQPLS